MLCVGVNSPPFLCSRLRVAVMRICLCAPNLVTEDPDPIWNRVHCGADTQAIWIPTHGIIWRFVSVRTVKTRWRFGSETVSFHVSICSCVFSYLPLSVGSLYVTCIISCDRLTYFTSVITYISSWDIGECSPYLCSWYEYLSASFHVLDIRRYWLRTSCSIS